MAFPVSGFLWLCLIGDWVARVRKNQRPDFISKRILIATLILLPVVILHASRTMNKVLAENEAAGCMMNMRNIQCAVRSYWGVKNLYSGKTIPWDEIFGPDKFVPTSIRSCPSGQDYILHTHIPAEYRLVVECPNPEHRKRLKTIDTSGW